MNAVALTGTLVADPRLHEDDAEPVRCRMRLAVSRHARGGQRGHDADWRTFVREALKRFAGSVEQRRPDIRGVPCLGGAALWGQRDRLGPKATDRVLTGPRWWTGLRTRRAT